MTQAYPLHWPHGWPRTAATDRIYPKFCKRETGGRYLVNKKLTVNDAVARVIEEIARMGGDASRAVLSTNLKTKKFTGFPISGHRDPDDPGAAVYFVRDGQDVCIAIDQYKTVAGNLAAIAATLEAMRGIERWGGATLLNRAFTGFTALPHITDDETWWNILGVNHTCTLAEAKAAYRKLAVKHHPDNGGDTQTMAKVNKAWQQAQEELA